MSVSPFGPLRVGPVVVAHTAASVEADADEEPPSHACDTEVLEVVEAVIEALAQAGVSAVSAAVSPRRPELPDALLKRPGTTIFNLVESTAGAATMEVDFARWLEARGVPFTGNPAAALRLALRKDLTREHLARFDIPMAEGVVAHSPDVALPDMPGPWFVKPAWADGSIGIDEGAMVEDAERCQARVAWLMRHLEGPCLVERYLPGPELNVALLPRRGTVHTATTAVDFRRCPAGTLPIVSYDCKWTPGTPAYHARSVDARELVDEATIAIAEQIARATFVALGCHGYARVDMRLDEDGLPRVIDVNPNPDLHPEAGLAIAAGQIGIPYDDLVLRIAAEARTEKVHHARPTYRAQRSRAAGRPARAY